MDKYRLTKDERREIQTAFRSYRGRRLSTSQKHVLRSYGINYGRNRGNHVFFQYNGHRVHCSYSPSDHRTGRTLSKKLIDLLESN